MSVKTITVTEDAYEALKSLKAARESFSETILRVSRRRPLRDFFGALSKESGDKLEKAILDMRKRHGNAHNSRIKEIAEALNG